MYYSRSIISLNKIIINIHQTLLTSIIGTSLAIYFFYCITNFFTDFFTNFFTKYLHISYISSRILSRNWRIYSRISSRISSQISSRSFSRSNCCSGIVELMVLWRSVSSLKIIFIELCFLTRPPYEMIRNKNNYLTHLHFHHNY